MRMMIHSPCFYTVGPAPEPRSLSFFQCFIEGSCRSSFVSLLEVGERDRSADAEQAGIDALDYELLQRRHLLDQASLNAAGRDACIGNAPQVRNIGAVIAEAHLHARRHEEDGRQNELQACGSFVSAFDEISTNDL